MADIAVMDSMLGKWKQDNSKTQNFEAFAAAMKIEGEALAEMQKENAAEPTYEMTKVEKDGKVVYKCVTEYLASKRTKTDEFQLGVEFEETEFGMKMKNLFTVEGDVCVGVTTIVDSGEVCKSKRYLKDGLLICEAWSTDGKTQMTAVMKKV